MDELTLQWIQGIKLLTIVVCAMLYGFGGMSGKWKRRFLSPSIYVAVMVGLSLWTGTFHWAIGTLLPIYILSFCMGYGGTTNTTVKIIKRALVGSVAGLAPLVLVLCTQGSLALASLHLGLCIATSVILGVWNVTQSARAEETTIATAYYVLPILTMI